ncbi:MAG: alpha/beta hydrolase [Cyanomargarita calcarea GSE-NOS-MK-12-04C]|jgi:esterase/lipase superfamily enzyme|uniref:Alpha/beta hydrolase n=1 Tax=Cyanomargarita calcarea GSE-NOS-MK-12-04C TaxID=2839659 RepID=A0A951QTJ5_9CYAN|nr:alpha/beta hydrolase [Cyanomargarita calcarea GSE-NOS-MK-12-04C]
MAYNLSKIQQLIKQALNAENFTDLCFNYFRLVHDNFTDGQSVSPRIRQLLEYAEKHREIPKLLEAIKECNPTVYHEFASELGNSESNQAASTTEVKTCDILVLAANPIGTNILQLEQEAALIRQRLQEGEVGKKYIVKVERAVQVEDLSKYLLQYQPLIVHFSGHGNPSGEIILNNSQGQAQLVSPVALAELLAIIRGRIECVVLNACFSLQKADALLEQISCVIGMSAEINDNSAVRFAAGFYRGLGFGYGYYKAFELGRNEVQLLNLPDNLIPHFVTRGTSLFEEEVVKARVTRTSPEKSTTATLYPLWFGTNRQPSDPDDVSKGFSGERDRQLHYGTCQVAVPKSHKIGSTGSSALQRFLNLTDDRLKLEQDSLNLLDEASFFVNIQQALQKQGLDKNSALVFIHGFNVSFKDAALRAAQIGVDLQVPGIMAFYSWPSKGKLASYTADEATIEASERYIAEFLLNLAQNSKVDKIHIIAHSMGNRGLLRAMQRILAQVQVESGISFGQIFLAAPDVDPDLFQELAAAYRNLAERTTLYVSAKDKALATSGIIHDHPRVGFFPPITVVEGLDTVEVSNIDLTLLGHGYFADARDLLQDIHQLLLHNTSPDKRFGLRTREEGTQKYWIIGQ